MAVYATANALSDKTQYPFFMRLVPPESGQQQMILEVTNYLLLSFALKQLLPDKFILECSLTAQLSSA